MHNVLCRLDALLCALHGLFEVNSLPSQHLACRDHYLHGYHGLFAVIAEQNLSALDNVGDLEALPFFVTNVHVKVVERLVLILTVGGVVCAERDRSAITYYYTYYCDN
jgi:hypothetical protein